MSIDAPYIQTGNKTDSQNINFIDTYVEYFTEVVLNYKNAIPETKHHRHKELQQHHHLTIIFQNSSQSAAPALAVQKSGIQRLSYNDKYDQFIKEINPPPPKLA